MLNIVWKCKKVHHEICVFCLGISSSIGVYVPENFLIVNCIIKHICMLTLHSKLWNWHAYSVTRRHVLFFLYIFSSVVNKSMKYRITYWRKKIAINMFTKLNWKNFNIIYKLKIKFKVSLTEWNVCENVL